jgi:probable rRNA maturation factor
MTPTRDDSVALKAVTDPLLLEIMLEDRRWADAIPNYNHWLRQAAEAALTAAHVNGADREAVLLLTHDDRMAALNAQFRGLRKTTNVLSWPSAERGAETPGAPPRPLGSDEQELGDMALAYEICAAEADAAGTPLPDHAAHLVVHGVLHLLGYDHQTDADADLMEGLEVAALSTIGVGNPYTVFSVSGTRSNG